jgi:hypothetical protein
VLTELDESSSVYEINGTCSERRTGEIFKYYSSVFVSQISSHRRASRATVHDIRKTEKNGDGTHLNYTGIIG